MNDDLFDLLLPEEPKPIMTMEEIKAIVDDPNLTDYQKYRGRCKDFCDVYHKNDPTLTLVRGHYYCPMWGKQAHWWLVDRNNKIIDPTAKQFPAHGKIGEYVPFDGYVECSNCGKSVLEDDASFESNYCFCSGTCHMRFVGL